MDILGIGPLELFFILIIALIVLGPSDMVKTGRTLGRFMYKVVTSPVWLSIKQASREMQKIPTVLMREAGLEEHEAARLKEEIGLQTIHKEVSDWKKDLSDWTTPPPVIDSPPPPQTIPEGVQSTELKPTPESDSN